MKKAMVLILVFLVCVGCKKVNDELFPYSHNFDYEENDDFDGAKQFFDGAKPFVGFFNDKGDILDKDYYHFMLRKKTGAIRFTLTGVPGVDSKVSVFGPDKQLLFTVNENGVGESEVAWRYYSPFNEFYFCIESLSGANEEIPYIFSFVPESSDNMVEIEPNNSVETATLLNIGATIKGFIVPADDVDFYRVVVDSTESLDFRVKAESMSGLDLSIMIYDEFSNEMILVNEGGNGFTEYSPVFGTDKGNFIVAISGEVVDAAKEPSYYMTIESLHSPDGRKVSYYEREFNDSIDSATTLIAGEELHATLTVNDIDYFAIDVFNEKGMFNLSISGFNTSRPEVVLLNSLGEEYEKIGDNYRFALRGLKAGRYYLRVSNPDSTYYKYQIFYGVY